VNYNTKNKKRHQVFLPESKNPLAGHFPTLEPRKINDLQGKVAGTPFA
jgi:hypothetical protein